MDVEFEIKYRDEQIKDLEEELFRRGACRYEERERSFL